MYILCVWVFIRQSLKTSFKVEYLSNSYKKYDVTGIKLFRDSTVCKLLMQMLRFSLRNYG